MRLDLRGFIVSSILQTQGLVSTRPGIHTWSNQGGFVSKTDYVWFGFSCSAIETEHVFEDSDFQLCDHRAVTAGTTFSASERKSLGRKNVNTINVVDGKLTLRSCALKNNS